MVIGHSVGGMVAKSLLVSGDAVSGDAASPYAVNPAAIQVIITLATPHTPVLLMDAQAHNFYDKVGFSFSPCLFSVLRIRDILVRIRIRSFYCLLYNKKS